MIRQVKLLKENTLKILLFMVLFYSLSVTVYSQDKIITKINDTIDCKITKITRNTIYFDMFTRGVKTAGSLPLSNVVNYTISATGNTEKPESFIRNSFERLRLGISGGAGYLLASSEKAEEYLASQGLESSKAKSYYRNMKTGWNANADLTFMITPDFGAGFKYKFFYTSGSVEGFFDPQFLQKKCNCLGIGIDRLPAGSAGFPMPGKVDGQDARPVDAADVRRPGQVITAQPVKQNNRRPGLAASLVKEIIQLTCKRHIVSTGRRGVVQPVGSFLS